MVPSASLADAVTVVVAGAVNVDPLTGDVRLTVGAMSAAAPSVPAGKSAETAKADETVAQERPAKSAPPTEKPASAKSTAKAATAGSSLTRAIADYIAGMTDRFAIKEHERLTGTRIFEND